MDDEGALAAAGLEPWRPFEQRLSGRQLFFFLIKRGRQLEDETTSSEAQPGGQIAHHQLKYKKKGG